MAGQYIYHHTHTHARTHTHAHSILVHTPGWGRRLIYLWLRFSPSSSSSSHLEETELHATRRRCLEGGVEGGPTGCTHGGELSWCEVLVRGIGGVGGRVKVEGRVGGRTGGRAGAAVGLAALVLRDQVPVHYRDFHYVWCAGRGGWGRGRGKARGGRGRRGSARAGLGRGCLTQRNRRKEKQRSA